MQPKATEDKCFLVHQNLPSMNFRKTTFTNFLHCNDIQAKKLFLKMFQEQYMEVVNPFILKNKERMIVFLDQLSSVTDPNPPPNSYIEASTSHICSDAGKIHATKKKVCIPNTIIPHLKDVNWLHYITFAFRI